MTLSEAPAIVLVNTILDKACGMGASDIHLEPKKEHLRVRFRIDGILYDQDSIDQVYMQQVLSRIKVIAHTNVAEYRIPQDGKFCYEFRQTSIDCRVATFPSVWGEKIVIRLLNRTASVQSLDKLGLSEKQIRSIYEHARQAQGLLLVTGPTGSGKTTTLHALLSAVATAQKNIITLEDPVEYHVEGITQAQIHPTIGFTFEAGIRALLRQDPDIIMVGEIRDKHTAHAAIQAALTGHLVMSTMHTNDSVSALLRLLDMAIEPFLLNATVTLVIAQRLARVLCTSCTSKAVVSLEQEQFIKKQALEVTQSYISTGCAVCHNTGHKGRIGIFEILSVTHELRSLITQQPVFARMQEQAIQDGMITLGKDAQAKVESGLISIPELIRILT